MKSSSAPTGLRWRLEAISAATERYDLNGVLHELRHRVFRRRRSGVPPLSSDAEPQVSVVCVSNRPSQLGHIVEMFEAQDWPFKDLVLVTNADDYATDAVVGFAGIHLVQTKPSVSLGDCLNQGFAAASGDVIARFDDDDLYAVGYLRSVVEVFRSMDAQVTGKAEYFAYVESQDRTVRRFTGKSARYVGRVAGGSLAVIAEAVRGVKFPKQNVGEDVEYMRSCERAGLRIWASGPKGFLQMRNTHGGHTWEIADRDFVAYANDVGPGRDPTLWS